MALEYLADLGGSVKPGDKIADALNARRVNALIEGVRATTRGDNLTAGPGILLKKSPGSVIISAAPAPRVETPKPRLVSVEITLDADTAPTSAQINAALVAFYSDDTKPREGDTFRISRVDTHYPEVEVQLTATELGPDWRFSPNSSVTIQEKPWYRIVRDISGRVYFEGAASKTTVDEAGVTVRNVSGSKTLTVPPASITADMTIRDLPVVVGSEIKIARVLASAPVSQDPPVTLPSAVEFTEGTGIEITEPGDDGRYISVNPDEFMGPDFQPGATLIKAEFISHEIPGIPTAGYIKYSSRIVNKSGSLVQLFTDDSGETWYFDLDSATKTKLAKIAVLEASLAFTDASVAVLEGDMEAAQDDIITMDTRIDLTNERIDTANDNIDSAFELLVDHGATLDDLIETVEIISEAQDSLTAIMTAMGDVVDGLQTAISGATISCDSSGVTLTWGTPPEGPPGP